jgi:hypothetical protein
MLNDTTLALQRMEREDPVPTIRSYDRDLRDVAVFGRSVTFVLQNIRTYYRDEFDLWYKPYEQEMDGDDLMCYFNHLRNDFLKEGQPTGGDVPTTIMVNVDEDEGRVEIFGLHTAPPETSKAKPPHTHLGQPVGGQSIQRLCRLYVDYLTRIYGAAEEFVAHLEARHDPA